MNRKHIWALVLIGIIAVILILTRGNTSVNLVVTDLKGSTSLVLLGFTAIGVVIGTLFK